MSKDSEAIRRVIQAFENSTWSEIDVRVGSLRVHLRSDNSGLAGAQTSAVRSEEARPPPEPAAASPMPSAAQNEPIGAEIAPGSTVIRSPSPGIFWRSPQPGAAPFADVDQFVDVNSTLCIVEVMKLMNYVKAGVRGKVVAVFGRDGVAVDKGEPLFAVDTNVRST